MICKTLSAEEIKAKQGETIKIDATQRLIQLDKLILEDDSTLLLDANMGQFSLFAKYVEIGNNVQILGVGNNAKETKPNASSFENLNKECFSGIDGQTGVSGDPGQNGIDINLSLAIAKLGNLEINTTGGQGGNGLAGQNGSDASQKEKCKRAKGGNGGNGGEGGTGGDGGSISIQYSSLNKGLSENEIAKRFSFKTKGGLGGKGAQAGTGGKGTKGYYSNRRSLTGSQVWVPSGKTGKTGKQGKAGKSGGSGEVNLAVSNKNFSVSQKSLPDLKTVTKTDKQATDTIELLKNKIDLLEKRIEKLESHPSNN